VTQTTAPSTETIPSTKVVGRPHPWRWVSYVVVALALALFIKSLLTNKNWNFDVVGDYLFDASVLKGLVVTVELTVTAMIAGLILGSIVAGFRLSSSRVLSGLAAAYIWFFRGVPVVVLIIFFVYLAQLYPYLSLGIPFGPQFVYFDTKELVAPMVGCIMGLTLNESAYLAEIIRGAVAAVPQGQVEAAAALGMTPGQVRRRVILPQILPIAVPPFFNNIISMTKTTAVVILASVIDLFSAVELIAGRIFLHTPLLLVATFWYLLLTAALTLVQFGLERVLTRHLRPTRP
jgi:polar amino acid transport system permease protein